MARPLTQNEARQNLATDRYKSLIRILITQSMCLTVLNSVYFCGERRSRMKMEIWEFNRHSALIRMVDTRDESWMFQR